jgi:polysaccharide pyruvyl transferase WcaK-like protein
MTIYFGGYGAGNLGDDLILKSILAEDPTAKIVAYGRPRLGWPCEFVETSRFLGELEQQIPGHPLMVFGGGGLFWSSEHIQELLIVALTAKTLGCKLHIRKVGLHGFHQNRDASRQFLRLAERVSFREHDSLDLARQYLAFDDGEVEPDYAYRSVSPVQRHPKHGKLRVGINVATTRFIDDPSFSTHVCQVYAGLARHFREQLEFHYIPFCNHTSSHNQNDLAKADLLFAESDGLIKYADVLDVDDLLECCSHCDFFIGERFHMHVIANAMKTPFVPFIHNQQTKYRAMAYECKDAPVYYETSQAQIINSLVRRVEGLISAARSAGTPAETASAIAVN